MLFTKLSCVHINNKKNLLKNHSLWVIYRSAVVTTRTWRLCKWLDTSLITSIAISAKFKLFGSTLLEWEIAVFRTTSLVPSQCSVSVFIIVKCSVSVFIIVKVITVVVEYSILVLESISLKVSSDLIGVESSMLNPRDLSSSKLTSERMLS